MTRNQRARYINMRQAKPLPRTRTRVIAIPDTVLADLTAIDAATDDPTIHAATARIRAALNEQPPQPTTPPVHLAKGTKAEDCPACRTGPTPDYPWICPGPATP